MKKVFISGPYTKGGIEDNVKNASYTASYLIDLGYAPYCPHLNHYIELLAPKPYSIWLDVDNAFLATCDAVLRIPGESFGADAEVELAKSLNIPTFIGVEDFLGNFNLTIIETRASNPAVDLLPEPESKPAPQDKNPEDPISPLEAPSK